MISEIYLDFIQHLEMSYLYIAQVKELWLKRLFKSLTKNFILVKYMNLEQKMKKPKSKAEFQAVLAIEPVHIGYTMVNSYECCCFVGIILFLLCLNSTDVVNIWLKVVFKVHFWNFVLVKYIGKNQKCIKKIFYYFFTTFYEINHF